MLLQTIETWQIVHDQSKVTVATKNRFGVVFDVGFEATIVLKINKQCQKLCCKSLKLIKQKMKLTAAFFVYFFTNKHVMLD